MCETYNVKVKEKKRTMNKNIPLRHIVVVVAFLYIFNIYFVCSFVAFLLLRLLLIMNAYLYITCMGLCRMMHVQNIFILDL